MHVFSNACLYIDNQCVLSESILLYIQCTGVLCPLVIDTYINNLQLVVDQFVQLQ